MTIVTASDEGVAVLPWQAVLEPVLRLTRFTKGDVPVQRPAGNYVVQRQRLLDERSLYCVDGQVGFTLPGLLDAVMTTLAESNIATDFIDLRTPCPEPRWELLGRELRPGQRDVLEMLCTQRNGIVKAATGLGKTETIVQFLKINPGLRVAVLTFGGKVRDSIYRRIKEGAPERTVCMLKADQPFVDADTYVLLDRSLHRLEHDAIDVLLIDEVHGAGSPKAFDDLLLYADKRVYGFSATPTGRHDGADAAAVALCGPVRVELPYEFSVRTGSNVPITVFVYDAEGPGDLKGKPDWLREKRGIWHNTKRNALIAHLCRQLADDEQAIILCRSLEHVLLLHRLLPDYTCVFRKPAPEREEKLLERKLLAPGWKGHPLFRLDSQTEVDFAERRIVKAIATPVWKEGVDFPYLRWVVRADGTANEIAAIQMGGRGSRRIAGEKEWAAVIDFWDGFSGFEQRTRQRIARYRKEGWDVQRIKHGDR